MFKIAILIRDYLPLLVVLIGAAATLRKWNGRNEKKTVYDMLVAVKRHIVPLVLSGFVYLLLLVVCSYAANKQMMSAFSMKFNYEDAAKGLFPDKTRFNASTLLNSDVLRDALACQEFDLMTDDLDECLQITSSYDETAVDEVNPKAATEYQISFTKEVLKYDVDTDKLIDAVASAAMQNFLAQYSENTDGTMPDLSGIDALDYSEVKDRLSLEAQKLRRFMVSCQTKAQTFRTSDGMTFQSLSKKLDDYINVGLEEYAAFVRENGITKHPQNFADTTEYTNRLLQVNYDKKMASYQTRINAIHMYDGKMASVVMVPTDDNSGEFYMSRTKIGVDYFAEEANAAINDASTLKTKMDNNEYTKQNVETSAADEDDYQRAGAMVQELIGELNELTDECMSAFELYQAAGREPLVGIHVYHPEIDALLSIKKNIALVMALEMMLTVFYMYAPRRKNGN